MECLVQPEDGLRRLIKGIDRASRSIEIVIFRFNRRELEWALARAVTRGVEVHALIANSNRGGEATLRELEMRLLAAGVTVTRTNGDLVRYHSKMMIIDRRELYLLAFNFTYQDINHKRSFGVITRNPQHVQEASRLFEADVKRQPYVTSSSTFVVSPVNARKLLAAFIQKARKELLIYDPDVTDRQMIRLLEARAKAGVNVRIIGRLDGGNTDLLEARPLMRMRLHARVIIRDGRRAFVGSQSLRARELDARREAGIIFSDKKAVNRLARIFEDDWETNRREHGAPPKEDEPAVAKVAKVVAKAVASDLSPVTPLVEDTVKEVVGEKTRMDLDPDEVESTVKGAIRDAVRNVVRGFVEEAAENGSTGGRK